LNGWGNDFLKNRIYWNPSDPNYVDNGRIMWTDSPGLLNDASGIISDPVNAQNFNEGAPPIVNLIDMLAWLSKTTGLIDAKTLFKWLEGQLPENKYLIQDPLNYPGNVIPLGSFNHGIGLQKTWHMLTNGTFNVTGMFNWLGHVYKADPYQLFYQLNNYPGLTAGTGSPDPMAIFYMMQNTNYIQQGDGSQQWIYHHALGSDAFWKFFNGSWWADFANMPEYWDTTNPWNTLPGRLFSYTNSLMLGQIQSGSHGRNESFNFFQMLINLGVLPEDWVTELQNENIKPFEMMAIYPVMNFTQLFTDAKNANKSTSIMVNGSFVLKMNDLNFYDLTHTYQINYFLAPSPYTVTDNLPYFLVPSRYYTAAGTYYYS
jgi:hypothetical protein